MHLDIARSVRIDVHDDGSVGLSFVDAFAHMRAGRLQRLLGRLARRPLAEHEPLESEQLTRAQAQRLGGVLADPAHGGMSLLMHQLACAAADRDEY
jgi:hypothetical protein